MARMRRKCINVSARLAGDVRHGNIVERIGVGRPDGRLIMPAHVEAEVWRLHFSGPARRAC